MGTMGTGKYTGLPHSLKVSFLFMKCNKIKTNNYDLLIEKVSGKGEATVCVFCSHAKSRVCEKGYCEVPKSHSRDWLSSCLVGKRLTCLTLWWCRNFVAEFKIICVSTTFLCYAFERRANEILYFVNLKERQEITKGSFLAIVPCILYFWEVLALRWFTYLYLWIFMYHT